MAIRPKLVLFSEVNGIVVDQGKPVAGAQLQRWYNWAWFDKEGVDQAESGPDGRFHFDRVVVRSITAGWLPHQPVITQKIDIIFDNNVHEAWSLVKMDYDDNGELDGKVINVLCDIATKPGLKGKLYGISQIR